MYSKILTQIKILQIWVVQYQMENRKHLKQNVIALECFIEFL